MGAITTEAPASSACPIRPGSFQRMRRTSGLPVVVIAGDIEATSVKPARPCCISMQTASFGSPLAEQPVAPRGSPEPHFLVKGEFPLKTFLALVESRHSVLPLARQNDAGG